jgi:hypothetical protein
MPLKGYSRKISRSSFLVSIFQDHIIAFEFIINIILNRSFTKYRILLKGTVSLKIAYLKATFFIKEVGSRWKTSFSDLADLLQTAGPYSGPAQHVEK